MPTLKTNHCGHANIEILQPRIYGSCFVLRYPTALFPVVSEINMLHRISTSRPFTSWPFLPLIQLQNFQGETVLCHKHVWWLRLVCQYNCVADIQSSSHLAYRHHEFIENLCHFRARVCKSECHPRSVGPSRPSSFRNNCHIFLSGGLSPQGVGTVVSAYHFLKFRSWSCYFLMSWEDDASDIRTIIKSSSQKRWASTFPCHGQ